MKLKEWFLGKTRRFPPDCFFKFHFLLCWHASWSAACALSKYASPSIFFFFLLTPMKAFFLLFLTVLVVHPLLLLLHHLTCPSPFSLRLMFLQRQTQVKTAAKKTKQKTKQLFPFLTQPISCWCLRDLSQERVSAFTAASGGGRSLVINSSQ